LAAIIPRPVDEPEMKMRDMVFLLSRLASAEQTPPTNG